MWRRVLVRVGMLMVVVLLALQAVPYGWWHENPPVRSAAPLTGRAAEIARAACMDCHSNETRWPWYSYVAPMSWLVRRDVEQGREAFNLSDWAESSDEAHDAVEVLEDGSMPPRQYALIHRDADLSDEERALLQSAFEQLDDGDRSGDRRGRGRSGDDDRSDDH